MDISIWTRSKGKLAVMLIVAFFEWCSFNSYLGLNPILTMVRLLPMFVTGVACNVVIALVVGHVNAVILIGAS
ncbi:hypothetical protein C8Q74DRAFT_1257729 [Fomes fomentarius]|nr:hypothetical protein C8Q74DRAFT_1257729 [Fomes fomentarius]